jgi:CRISPR/Cas system-associated protein Cas10 (large subunit of type III CRISPR-Cas system)
MGDAKCGACGKTKKEDEFKKKRDGFNAVCKVCTAKRKLARDRARKKNVVDSDSEDNKENLPEAMENLDENDEEEHMRKECSILTLEQFINTLIATEDVRSLMAFVDLSALEGGSEREKADELAKAIWEQLKYRFM